MKIFALVLASAVCAVAAPFELKDGDRVLLLGDALLERENTYGLLETRMHEQFPNVKFTVRNLSWSGETPKGWSRASFDKPEVGWQRLKEQIAEVKPTVAILGFGMAASLQEMTDRSGDQTLNPDPVRYGAEPMSAGRFKKELGELMDAINASTPDKQPARFVLLSPISHEDLSKYGRSIPDDVAAHNALLNEYSGAIADIAKTRNSLFVDCRDLRAGDGRSFRTTDNGIQLSSEGYLTFTDSLMRNLIHAAFDPKEEKLRLARLTDDNPRPDLVGTVNRKNDLFFHQFRPANSTYLFGFRKHEQGRNAAEMPQFTPLIDAVDTEIDRLKKQPTNLDGAPKQNAAATNAGASTATSSTANNGAPSLPLPNFSTTDNLEITLWADSSLVGKPVGMNWDSQGRLWVACSPVYPQIAPGGHPDDRVMVLEDTDHDGKADKSTNFATNFLIAAGVAPDFGAILVDKNDKELPPQMNAAYVGASTELLRLDDDNGDGKADRRRIVLSGFGTEDTHHTIHTLRWGPDGRLYFNQSIYIHSHMETPYGMVRLNSGGICAYDPKTERVEVVGRGFINTWGHAWDRWGQSFATDGAGFEGVHWLVPGAMYRTYEGARRILPSISPGSYPKYAGLEIIQSPLFPADWQGNAITCDFRAHKITRFQINDLSLPTDGKEPLSGYITKELPNPIVTTDASFRPIDVKLGPDGALYIADWTNPIINHGEVDFRDPRRDHVNGRIWRVAPKGAAPLKWEPMTRASAEPAADSNIRNQWSVEQARRFLSNPRLWRTAVVDTARFWALKLAEAKVPADVWSAAQVEALNFGGLEADRTLSGPLTPQKLEAAADARTRAIYTRSVGKSAADILRSPRAENPPNSEKPRLADRADGSAMRIEDALGVLHRRIDDPAPRVRVEAMRALARIPTAESVSLVLKAAINVPGGAATQVRSEDKGTSQFNQPTFSDTADPYYGYAAWLSINDLDDVFLAALAEGKWKPDTAEREKQLAWALGALRPEKAGKALSAFITKNGLPKDGSGPWIELIGQAGGPGELRIVLDGLLANTVPDGDDIPPLADKALAYTNKEANRRAAAALVVAAKRGVKPANPPYGGWQFHMYAPNEAINDAIRLAGLWKQDVPAAIIARITNNGPKERLDAIFESLRTLGTDNAANFLTAFMEPKLAKQIDNQFLNMVLEENQPAIRRRALGALAGFRPDVSLAFLRGVLDETDSNAQLALWRELFSSDPFNKALLAKMPTLTKEQATPALRAARELGKRGEKLVAAFTPLAGEAPAAPIPQDFAWMVDLTKKNGNPVEGELIYRRAALTCTVCHAIGGAGGKVGPDLGTIGASAPLDYIIESTMNPAVKVKEGFHAVAVTTKDGKTLSGTVAKETDTGLVLRDMTGAEQTVEKSNVKERTNIGSLMPAGLINPLNDREKSNLFAFLSQLGKPGPFDAGKPSVARAWRIYPGGEIEQVVAGKADAAKGVAVFSMVDGRVTKDLMEIPVAMAGDQPTLAAVARFNVVTGGPHRLHLAGITKAWLDGAPLAIASEPNPVVNLSTGDHTLVVKLDTKTLPEHFRAECEDGRFLTE